MTTTVVACSINWSIVVFKMTVAPIKMQIEYTVDIFVVNVLVSDIRNIKFHQNNHHCQE
jgi:hypothetical protein